MNSLKSIKSGLSRGDRMELLLVAIVTMLVLSVYESAAQTGTITLGGANPTLTINTGAAGSEPIAVMNTATTLRYWRKAAIAKVTVRTTCPGQSFTLQVLATGVVRGGAAGQVTLTDGMAAVDFIVNIPSAPGWTSATITLQYTASATFSQGRSTDVGNDVHTVTYTLQVQ